MIPRELIIPRKCMQPITSFDYEVDYKNLWPATTQYVSHTDGAKTPKVY